jgi:hypothetical protein
MKTRLKIQGGQVYKEHQNCDQIEHQHETSEYQEMTEKGKEASAIQRLDGYRGEGVVEEWELDWSEVFQYFECLETQQVVNLPYVDTSLLDTDSNLEDGLSFSTAAVVVLGRGKSQSLEIWVTSAGSWDTEDSASAWLGTILDSISVKT